MFLRINPMVILENPFSPAAVSWRVPRDVKLLCDGPSRIKEESTARRRVLMSTGVRQATLDTVFPAEVTKDDWQRSCRKSV